MEHDPLKPALPESKGDKEKKTRRKKRGFVAPLPVETADKPETHEEKKPERSALDEALANLAIKKREDAEAKESKKIKEEKKKPEPEVPELESERTEVLDTHEVAEPAVETKPDTTVADEAQQSHEESEPLLVHELKPNEFSGGEVIIELQGDKPVVERVLPADSNAAEPIERADTTLHLKHQETSTLPTPSVETTPVIPAEHPPTVLQSTEPVQVVAEVLPRPEYLDSPFTTPAAVVAERPATKQDVVDALRSAEKAGQDQGELAGLLAGGGYEHLRHKKREKRLVSHLEEQSKRFEQATESQRFQAVEQARTGQRQEQQIAATQKLPEKKPVKPNQNFMPQVPEQLNIPADRRLEASAWHTIEVDSKTGRAVEDPAFAYGHEYYRERAPEATPAMERNAAAGDVALTAAALAQAPGGGTLPPPSAAIPNAATQGSPPRSQSTPSGDGGSPLQSGPLWPWVTALIVIICLIAIIR